MRPNVREQSVWSTDSILLDVGQSPLDNHVWIEMSTLIWRMRRETVKTQETWRRHVKEEWRWEDFCWAPEKDVQKRYFERERNYNIAAITWEQMFLILCRRATSDMQHGGVFVHVFSDTPSQGMHPPNMMWNTIALLKECAWECVFVYTSSLRLSFSDCQFEEFTNKSTLSESFRNRSRGAGVLSIVFKTSCWDIRCVGFRLSPCLRWRRIQTMKTLMKVTMSMKTTMTIVQHRVRRLDWSCFSIVAFGCFQLFLWSLWCRCFFLLGCIDFASASVLWFFVRRMDVSPFVICQSVKFHMSDCQFHYFGKRMRYCSSSR